ncbi:MAG: hypothetical protein CML64_07055 [Rhodobacteraceae bacterium]|nr:hypothetical protein [Paracoccaceae bacterium]
MTRWFVIFLTSLLIVLGARYGTYSPLPKAVFVDCETPVAENKLQGLWELDRIDNYEAFHEGLESNSGFLSYLETSVYPFILARSQLYRIEQCGREIALTVNYLRSWLVASAEIDEPDIQLELQDFKSELKQTLEETFQEVLTDVKDALAIEAKPEADRVLKFLQKSDSLNISAELIFAGEEITIYGSLNGRNYKERIYYDAGELVREIAFVDSKLGSTDFIYRRYP